MKKLLLAFILFSFSVAINAKEKEVLSVVMKDNTSIYFLLTEKPVVTFKDDNIRIISETDEAMMKRSLVERLEFVPEASTAVDDTDDAKEKLNHRGDAILVTGLDEGCKVSLFSIDGKVQMSSLASTDGCVTLLLKDLPSGIYLVKYNETVIKILK